MKKLLFILPGLHGDTIINMPAAKWWADRGWDVTWATQDTWTYRAFFKHFPYVTPFFAKHGGGKFFQEVDHLAKGFDKVIDLYRVGFKNPHEEPRERDNHLVHFRYKLAGVDSEERWKLSWKRFPAREDALFKRVVGKLDRYTLVHDETWCGSLKLGKPNHPVVRFRQIKPYSIFDWYKVILHASEILCIDSSLANFIEVLPAALQIPKTVVTRKEAMWSSIYRSNWRIVHGNLPEQAVVSFGLNDTKLDVPSKLIETEPPKRRGEGKLLVASKGAVSVRDIADLPELLRGRAVYANNSKVRRGKFWLYRDTGHRFGATLLRRAVDGRWLAHVEAPPALVMDGRYVTADRNRVTIREEWKLPNTYLLAFEREPEFEKFANLYQYPGHGGPSRPGDMARHESVYSTVDGSVVPDSSGLRLDAKIIKKLKLRYVTYHADMSQAEARGTAQMEPEFYSVDESPNGDAVCVGSLAARAVESFAATGKTSGMTTLRLEREPKWRKITGLLLPLPLPVDSDGDVLLAALGRKLFVQLMKRGVREKMRFGRFGDLILVL